MHVLGNIQSKHIKADPRVHEEYQRLRNATAADAAPWHELIQDSVCLSLLNVRSLSKHSIDIKHDPTLFNSDLILCSKILRLGSKFCDDAVKFHD